MKSIAQGDIFLTKSPIQSEDASTSRKLLSSLLLIGARPVLIIRPPMDWDTFSTVTVIPAYTNTEPCIRVDQEDNYGAVTSSYSFIPHIIQTIPVAFLSRHVGHLTDAELKNVTKSIHWLTGTDSYRSKENHPTPKQFSSAALSKINRSRCSYATVVIDSEHRISFSDDDTVPYAPRTFKVHPTIPPTGPTVPVQESVSVLLTKEEPKKEEPSSPLGAVVSKNIVRHNTQFPKSMFAQADLCEVADRFEIAQEFYIDKDDNLKRSIDLLTHNELMMILEGLNPSSKDCVLNTYEKMHSVDALVFGPHLPTAILARLCFLNHPETIALKKICSKLKDLSDEEILARSLERVSLPDLPAEEPSCMQHPEDPYAPYTDQNEIRAAVSRLRPYLSETGFHQLPRKLQIDFIRVPEHYLRRAYSGKNFAKNYAYERQFILDHINE